MRESVLKKIGTDSQKNSILYILLYNNIYWFYSIQGLRPCQYYFIIYMYI